MKNKKYLKAAISLGVGAILLTSAAFANYENASGYSVCKNALKKVAYAGNFSADPMVDITIDGETIAKTYGCYKLNEKGNPSYQSETTEVMNDYIYFSKTVHQDDTVINMMRDDENGELRGNFYDNYSKIQSIASSITGDEKTGEKFINFLEALSDTLVGDLKNSVILTSSDGNIKSYNITLSKEQLPAFVNSGVSLLTSAIKTENAMVEFDGNNPYDMIFRGGEPYIKNVSANMSVDDKGNPVQFSVTANIFGEDINGNEHILSTNVSVDFYDFGTTEIERVSDEELAKLRDVRINAIETEIETESE